MGNKDVGDRAKPGHDTGRVGFKGRWYDINAASLHDRQPAVCHFAQGSMGLAELGPMV
jgi:hypothetical protein